ncbi:MAG: carbon-nitrogen family hydrolase [Anaerolineales bacterium]|nr:carbon-nitrogen family hydrolase [Anaerolineales bacterium]
MKRTISLGQMDVQLGNPEANWQTVQAMTAEAKRRGSDVVVFPELWSTGYDLENAVSYATPTDAGLFAQVAALAKAQQIAILGSCLSLLGEGQFGNTAVYFDGYGRSQGQYSKLHLFRLMQEEQFLTAGEAPTLVEAEWGKAGLTICYDLRFPELFRRYALAGAQVVFVPAEWPHPRLAHWRTLLRARAIENQMFVVACNRVGNSKGTDFFGHSCILDPWGEAVIELGEGEMLGTAEIDIAQVDAVRATIPVFTDRRPEVY